MYQESQLPRFEDKDTSSVILAAISRAPSPGLVNIGIVEPPPPFGAGRTSTLDRRIFSSSSSDGHDSLCYGEE